ncbi:MAG: hypothetical protein KGD61_07555 [Candidatus Lokiarchaeota archaeon]|nr:hypothetical protein [Candidatus Lokiarchaeota archaeon]
MNEINKYLQQDEKILWQNSRTKNLLLFNQIFIVIIVILALIAPIPTFFALTLNSPAGAIAILSIFVIAIVYLIIHKIKTNKFIREKLALSPEKLRNYEFFDILTNKRYIRRNFYENFYGDLSKYSKEVLEIKKDLIFLNLNRIGKVAIDYLDKEIYLILKGHENENDFYLKYSKNELNKIMNALINSLSLVKVDEYPDVYTEFIPKRFYDSNSSYSGNR